MDANVPFSFHSTGCEKKKKKKKKRTSNYPRKIKAFCSISGSNFSLDIVDPFVCFVLTFVDVYTFLDLEEF